MTIKVDGTNGVLQAYDYQVLTTGFTYTFAAGTQLLLAVPAGTLATGTVTMPAAPADGMNITITSTQEITALTINANTGQSIVGGGVIALRAGGSQTFIYRLSNTTWYSQNNNTATVVTSAVAGNGVAVSAATGAVTFSAVAPTALSVGAYCMAMAGNWSSGAIFTATAGTSYAAGGANGQVKHLYTAYSGCNLSDNFATNLSGTWRWMGATTTVIFAVGGVFCRVA